MSIHEEYDLVFKALASHVRRQILDTLRDQPLTTGTLCGNFANIDRCTVMQHLRVLEDAGLVIAERRGRERWNHLNAIPIRGYPRPLDRPACGGGQREARAFQAIGGNAVRRIEPRPIGKVRRSAVRQLSACRSPGNRWHRRRAFS